MKKAGKPTGKKIGYIRISTVDQCADRQLDGMDLDKVFMDKASGKDTHRPELEKMLDYAREDDTIIVHSMDRLARNLVDLRGLVNNLTERGVRVSFVKENITFTGDDEPMSIFLLSVMGAFAEFERSMIRERQREGIAIAKKRGVYTGRKPALTDDEAKDAVSRAASGEKKKKIAASYGISRQSLYRYIAEHKRDASQADKIL
jgi:DNA invertase Pin-like site-specific DNA recombinase